MKVKDLVKLLDLSTTIVVDKLKTKNGLTYITRIFRRFPRSERKKLCELFGEKEIACLGVMPNGELAIDIFE